MELTILERKSRVLTPARLPCLGRMPTLRIAASSVSAETVSQLQSELARRRAKPPAVCLDFADDPFQPVMELLDQSYKVLEYLLGEGIGVVFQTKAQIPPRHIELLLAHAPLVRAIVPLVTMNLRTLRIFEPHAATPRTRLRQMRQLVDGCVATLARVDPILPGVTDDPDTMHGLCAALADAGIREIAAGTLVLRPAVLGSLRRHLARPQLYRRIIGAFDGGTNERLPGIPGTVRVLPAAHRRRIFQWLTKIAGQYGIQSHICTCKNPDLDCESCKLAGQWSPPEIVERQLELFQLA